MKGTIDLPYLTPKYVVENAHNRHWASKVTANGDGYDILEDGSDLAKRFDAVALERGLQRLVEHAVTHKLTNGKLIAAIFTGYPDGTHLDYLLQLALFGEERYA